MLKTSFFSEKMFFRIKTFLKENAETICNCSIRVLFQKKKYRKSFPVKLHVLLFLTLLLKTSQFFEKAFQIRSENFPNLLCPKPLSVNTNFINSCFPKCPGDTQF